MTDQWGIDDLLRAWYAAIVSGRAAPENWIAWADRRIAELDDPDYWLLEFCVANTPEAALSVLRGVPGKGGIEVGELVLGHYWSQERHSCGDLFAFLLRCGKYADSETTDPTKNNFCPEIFYSLASRIKDEGEASICRETAEALGPYAEEADWQWMVLCES